MTERFSSVLDYVEFIVSQCASYGANITTRRNARYADFPFMEDGSFAPPASNDKRLIIRSDSGRVLVSVATMSHDDGTAVFVNPDFEPCAVVPKRPASDAEWDNAIGDVCRRIAEVCKTGAPVLANRLEGYRAN
jgi:hypothetical protein